MHGVCAIMMAKYVQNELLKLRRLSMTQNIGYIYSMTVTNRMNESGNRPKYTVAAACKTSCSFDQCCRCNWVCCTVSAARRMQYSWLIGPL